MASKRQAAWSRRKAQQLAAADWPSDLMLAMNEYFIGCNVLVTAARSQEKIILGFDNNDRPSMNVHQQLLNRAEALLLQDEPNSFVKAAQETLGILQHTLEQGYLYDYSRHLWTSETMNVQTQEDRHRFCLAAAEAYIDSASSDQLETMSVAFQALTDFGGAMLNEQLLFIRVRLEEPGLESKQLIARAIYALLDHIKWWDDRLTSRERNPALLIK